jgi:hypothetical protein
MVLLCLFRAPSRATHCGRQVGFWKTDLIGRDCIGGVRIEKAADEKKAGKLNGHFEFTGSIELLEGRL